MQDPSTYAYWLNKTRINHEWRRFGDYIFSSNFPHSVTKAAEEDMVIETS